MNEGVYLELGRYYRFFDPRVRTERFAQLISFDKENAIFWDDDNKPLAIARRFIRCRHRFDYEERRNESVYKNESFYKKDSRKSYEGD